MSVLIIHHIRFLPLFEESSTATFAEFFLCELLVPRVLQGEERGGGWEVFSYCPRRNLSYQSVVKVERPFPVGKIDF